MNNNETSQYADYKNVNGKQGNPYPSSWKEVHKNYKREGYESDGRYKLEEKRKTGATNSVMKKFNGSIVANTFSLLQCHEI